MTIIEKIVFNPEWNKIMTQIDRMSFSPHMDVSFECLHGYSHALTVARISVEILKQLKSSEHDVVLAEISALLHDIALVNGKENHAVRGAKEAEKFLNKFNLGKGDIDLITHAIANHSNGDEINNNLDLALLVADKLDVARNRLATTKGKLTKELNKVHDVLLKITDKSFILEYKTDNDFNKYAINDWSKMITIPQKAAIHLGREFVFKINDEVQDCDTIISAS